MSLDDVARVTKIQPRILERLEAGKLDGLPAEVFVRGFVRSFARCVGLDEREALRRYTACALGSQDLAPTVRALVEAMADLAPGSAIAARATPRKMQAVEVIDLASPALLAAPAAAPADPDASPEPPVVEPDAPPSAAELAAPTAIAVEAPAAGEPARPTEPAAPAQAAAAVQAEAAPSPPSSQDSSSRKRRRRKARAAALAAAAQDAGGLQRESLAVGTLPTASPVIAPIAAEPGGAEAAVADATGAAEPVEPPAPWQPKMPPIASPSVPWRRAGHRLPGGSGAAPGAPALPVRPSLVIDDADPESAERVLEERAEILAPRRSFLPPILLDREDRSGRQGGLTLAVILLLIAATLTLSYPMRRPSASGDGVTGREAPAQRAQRG